MAKVGVEESLTDVEQALQARGHQVVALHSDQDAANCDCCVVSGQHDNMMGMADTKTQASVISAEGLTADEVCELVESKVK
ncbi:hypothetical protein CR203_02065 [Salipaludibacillus neizhouensis]|uniref:UPF0180 protein CR203_02065 n=1 Tax=Salipaludibacillus neizhouensis TaxID=885475 RepID=A0A3A9KDM1_9BACI|nr:YkuS family protein [Salipaludibacillus neizhouensis]RKL68850.1 hypothetical protein CR203_02065 [Salipaludibacillus neizhouensis]